MGWCWIIVREFKSQKKNPKGRDGKTLTCFLCGSEYHMKDRCDKNKKNNTKLVSSDATRTSEMSMLAVSTPEVASEHEIVMVSENEEQLCLLIEEAGLQGVIDSACSKTVAGIRFILNFLYVLAAEMKDLIDML